MKGKEFLLAFALLIGLLFTGCVNRPDLFEPSGSLSFSNDTVYFDTIFTSLPSPTERLVVRNNTGKNILLSEVKLQSGQDYSLIFDGITANTIRDFEFPKDDSVIAFIKFTSDRKDEFSRDQLVFTIGSEVQKVEIEAFIMDAIFYRDSVLGGFGSGNMTVLGPEKKHLIDGCLLVSEGHTLRILPGTELYFSPKKDDNFNLVSAIKVFGRLIVEGTKDAPVIFKQTRYGEDFEESGGQWRGIAFASTAKASSIDHAIIKNGLIGIYQEYGNSGIGPKVRITNTEIRNMGAYGLLSAGFTLALSNYPQVVMQNCLVTNCVEGTVGLYGGGYHQFEHCTFGNYTVDFTRNSPQLIVNNYDDNAIYPARTHFQNCIIWGSEEEEFAADSFPIPNFYNVTFENCLIRTTLPIKGFNNYNSTNPDFPRFVDPSAGEPTERNYRLREGSPAIGVGNVIGGLELDLDGYPRDGRPDAGCYEFIE